jgi:non-homologous end joining protein Ku
VIRETIREMNKVAIGRVVLTNREHIIALEAFDKGLMGTLLRYPYEVRSEAEYFDDIQDVKVTKDMLDLVNRQPEGREIRADKIRGSVRSCAGRAHQQQTSGKADPRQSAASWRERCRPDGRAAPEHRYS